MPKRGKKKITLKKYGSPLPQEPWRSNATIAMLWLYATLWLWASIRATRWVTVEASPGIAAAATVTSPNTPSLCRVWSQKYAASSHTPHMNSMSGTCKISKDKCPLKFIKKSVGTYNRAKRKRGKEQSPGSHEESSSQEGLNPLPSVYNTASLELEKEIKNF